MDASLKDIVYSFIQSIDLFNYLLKNHHRRVAVITWHIGKKMKLDPNTMSRAVLAAALHDIGALTIKERNQLIEMDINNPHPHARLGSYMIESFPPFKPLSTILFYHHWPYTMNDDYSELMGPVPIESYIIHLADRVDIAIDLNKPTILQAPLIRDAITERAHYLFHPEVYKAFLQASEPDRFWLDIDNTSMAEILEQIDGDMLTIELSTDLLEELAFTISKIIDCRSAFTSAHSFGVSEVSYKLAQLSNLDDETCRKIKIAGLLHDIGKVGISTELLEKPGPLTDEERQQIHEHAYYTNKILHMPKGLHDIAEWAAHHHEDHLGHGYPDNYLSDDITIEMDIIAYADIFTALAENRPYREGLPLHRILSILEDQFMDKHGSSLFNQIKTHQEDIYSICKDALAKGHLRYDTYLKRAAQYEEEFGKTQNIPKIND